MKIIDKIKTKAKDTALKQAISMVSGISSEVNLLRLIKVLEAFIPDEKTRKSVNSVKKHMQGDSNHGRLGKRILKQLSPNCKKKFLTNLLVNFLLNGNAMRNKLKEELGYKPPSFFIVSPSMRCNLRCVGCWAGNYTQKDDLTFEEMDDILKQAKELGMYFIVVGGGEPFFYKPWLKLFEKHNDMYFLVYTNGTLITKQLANKLAELGNVAPAISVDGLEEDTDKRRGEGTYKKTSEAMDNLKEAGVFFGFSAVYSKPNHEAVSSDEFIDYCIGKGCLFGWYFQYIPIGLKPDVKLMATPEQRNELREKIEKFRHTKDIFIGDFWNDGPYVNGCMAGGRLYFHINCKGDVEPCGFVHFAVDNIKNKTLKEAIDSPFFKAMRKSYLGRDNLLAPCMIIDKPEVMRGIMKKFHAKPTHPGAESIIEDPKITKYLDEYSKKVEKITRPIWEKEYRPGWEKRTKKLEKLY